jgi:hypothetical protein
MAILTIAIDPELLEAAKLEAERRHITLDQFFADSVSTYTPTRPSRKRDNSNLIRLMNEGALGKIDRPLTREEIYAERTWPRP